MALDFYSLNDVKTQYLLFSVDVDEFELMEDIWGDYKKQTGIFIDPYRASRIYQDHVQLIASIIDKSLANIIDPYSKHVRLNLLNKISMVKEVLLVIGD